MWWHSVTFQRLFVDDNGLMRLKFVDSATFSACKIFGASIYIFLAVRKIFALSFYLVRYRTTFLPRLSPACLPSIHNAFIRLFRLYYRLHSIIAYEFAVAVLSAFNHRLLVGCSVLAISCRKASLKQILFPSINHRRHSDRYRLSWISSGNIWVKCKNPTRNIYKGWQEWKKKYKKKKESERKEKNKINDNISSNVRAYTQIALNRFHGNCCSFHSFRVLSITLRVCQ